MKRIKKILVVEDVQFNLYLLETILKSVNIEYKTAKNGKEALDILEKNSDIELVLMDIETPVMDGKEAIGIIRNEFAYPNNTIPVIATTAHLDSSYLRNLIEVGFNGYLVKPVSKEKIQNCLSSNAEIICKYRTLQGDKNCSDKETSISYNIEKLKEWSGEDEIVMKELLGLFLAEAPKTLATLEQAVFQEDWQMIKDEAHKYSPQVSFLGVEDLVENINQLEKNALQIRDINIIKKLFFDIKNKSNNLIDQIVADFHIA